MTTIAGAITQELIYQVAYEANKRAAIVLPKDSLTAFGEAFQRETKPLARCVTYRWCAIWSPTLAISIGG